MKKLDETQSFEQIYTEVFPLVYKVSYHITGNSAAAEDICQEAFIKYYNRPVPLPTLNDAKYWLIRVVKNLSFNYGKREKRKQKVFEKIKHEPYYSEETGEKEILKKETKETVNRVLDNLPEKLKAPLVLREFSGLNYKEISKVLGISESNVKVRIFRARENIQKMIDRGDIYVP
jgi:RNA polymerase sigma-70 factor (ECF subfamily)